MKAAFFFCIRILHLKGAGVRVSAGAAART